MHRDAHEREMEANPPVSTGLHRPVVYGALFIVLACLVTAKNHGHDALHAQVPQPASIQFTDVTTAYGIKFAHINREEFGPGACVADFDGDSWPDIYFVNGRAFMAAAGNVGRHLSEPLPSARWSIQRWTSAPTLLLVS
jgi:hypothetical protein